MYVICGDEVDGYLALARGTTVKLVKDLGLMEQIE
jgi:hypothetical protein